MDSLSIIDDTKVTRLATQIRNRFNNKIAIPFKICLPNGDTFRFGDGEPAFTITINDHNGLTAITRFDELHFTEAYINGSLDIDGDIWGVIGCREALRDIHPLHYFWRRISPLLAGQIRTNRHAISDHYEHDNEFFLTFLDSTRCYSQAIFERDDESLTTAQRRKLEFAVASCKLNPGNRVLDVGGGWGAFVEYAGSKGIHVTALTLARDS